MSYTLLMNIVHAHTGLTLLVNPHRFVSIDSFKAWIHEAMGIPKPSLFLLTPFGARFKFLMLNEGPEVYVFDKRLFSAETHAAQTEVVLKAIRQNNADLATVRPSVSPLVDLEAELVSPRTLQSKLVMNGGWSAAVLRDCTMLSDAITLKLGEVNTLFKALNVIIQFYGIFCGEIETDFAQKLQALHQCHQSSLVGGWRTHYSGLSLINLAVLSTTKTHHSSPGTLASLLDEAELDHSAERASKLYGTLDTSEHQLRLQIEANNREKQVIDRHSETLRNRSIQAFRTAQVEANEWLREVQRLVEALQVDYKNLHHLNEAEMATIFRIHKSQHVTQITSAAERLYTNLDRLMRFKEEFLTLSVTILQLISRSQLQIVRVRDSIKTITPCLIELQETEYRLSHVVDLPLLYGLFLVESVRRTEWHEVFRNKAANTAEHFAALKEHERACRKQWGDRFGFITLYLNLPAFAQDDDLPELDISLSRGRLFELDITRAHILQYVESLKGNEKTMEALTKAINALDTTLKFEERDMTAEAPTDFVQGLQLRIKKLESLLHQQSLQRSSTNSPSRGISWKSSPQSLLFDAASMTAKTSFRGTEASQLVVPRRHTFNSGTRTLEESILIPPTPADGPPSRVYESTVVDKHLDHIKSKKELVQSKAQNEELTATIRGLTVTVSEHEKTVARLNEALAKADEKFDQLFEARNDLEEKVKAGEKTILQSEALVASAGEREKALQGELAAVRHESAQRENELTFEKAMLLKQIEAVRLVHELEEATRNALLERMAVADERASGERKRLENELEQLRSEREIEKAVLAQLRQERELEKKAVGKRDVAVETRAVAEGLEGGGKSLSLLREALNGCANKADVLSRLVFLMYRESCLTLENIGLLLVEKDLIPAVIRVKGLKNKSLALVPGSGPPATAFAEVAQGYLEWMPLDLERFDLQETNDRFETFVKSVTFKEADLIKKSIVKRFGDVETLAKRLQKEFRLAKEEVQRVMAALGPKLSIRDFTTNDLVMFLPTREPDDKDKDPGVLQPWAAFNVGSPHYFLYNDGRIVLEGRDFVLARVVSIRSFEVTAESAASLELNPFRLGVGVAWFSIEAVEEC